VYVGSLFVVEDETKGQVCPRQEETGSKGNTFQDKHKGLFTPNTRSLLHFLSMEFEGREVQNRPLTHYSFSAGKEKLQ